MALSGFHTGSATNGLSVRVRWSARQNVNDKLLNRSYVTANVYLVLQSGYSVIANAVKYGSVSIDGVSGDFNKVLGSIGGGEHWVGSYSRYVNHNDNGTKSFNISAQFAPNVTIYGAGWVGNLTTGTKSYTLDTIPRASSITKYSGDMGDNFYVDGYINYEIKSASTSFRHVIRLYRNNGTLATRDIPAGTTSGTITLTTAERNLFYGWAETWKSADIVMEVTTYLNSTKIGDTQVFPNNRRAYVKESIAKPTLGAITYIDLVSSVTALTGNNQYLVQGKSKPRVSVASANSRLSSKIKNVSVTIGNETKSVAFNTTSTGAINFDFSEIKVSNTTYGYITATDSRGFSTHERVTVYVFPYTRPKFVLYGANRRNGFDDQSYLSYKISCFEIVYSTINVKYWIKLASETDWGVGYDVTGETTFEKQGKEYIGERVNRDLGEPTNTKEHTIRIRITDHFGSYDQQFILNAASGLAIIDKDGLAFQEVVYGIAQDGTKSPIATIKDIMNLK